MVINLYMDKYERSGDFIRYKFYEEGSTKEIATVTNNIREGIILEFDEKKYYMLNYPKIVRKVYIGSKYPLSSKHKKTVGFYVHCNEEVIAKYYHEAITCRKKGFFKKNIGLTVFEYLEQGFSLYRVGFAEETSHYYCLYDNSGNTIAVVEKNNKFEDDIISTIYIEEESNVLLTLIACTEEIISVAISGDISQRIDSSAGNYISLLEEEKQLLDRAFITRIKELNQ